MKPAMYTRLESATGSANPSRDQRGTYDASKPGRDAGSGFYELDNPAGGLPGPTGEFHDVKTSAHAHDRMEERTPFHKSYVNHLQRAVDTLDLHESSYHLPLRHQSGEVAGYAQFKRVPNRDKPVLATILGPKMKPGGLNIEPLMKLNSAPDTNEYGSQAHFDTDNLDPVPREALGRNPWSHRLANPETVRYAVRQALGATALPSTGQFAENSEAAEQTPQAP